MHPHVRLQKARALHAKKLEATLVGGRKNEPSCFGARCCLLHRTNILHVDETVTPTEILCCTDASYS